MVHCFAWLAHKGTGGTVYGGAKYVARASSVGQLKLSMQAMLS